MDRPRNGRIWDVVVVGVLLGLGLIQIWPLWTRRELGNEFSAPVVPAIALGLQGVGIDYNLGLLIVITLGLLITPVTWLALSSFLTENRWAGIITGLLLMLPVRTMIMGRLEAVTEWGDGAHMVALAILPIVMIFWVKFLKFGKFKFGLLSALGLAMLALVSPFGLVASIMFLTILLFSEMLLGQGRLKLARTIFVLVIAVGWLAWWYHPQFIYTVLQSPQGKDFMNTVTNLIPISFVVVPVLATFGFLLFEKRVELQSVFVAVFLTLMFLVIAFARNAGDRIWYVPFRFFPELGGALALLGGVMVDWMYRNKYQIEVNPYGLKALRVIKRFRKLLAGILILAWLIIYMTSISGLWEQARSVEKQSVVIDIRQAEQQLLGNLLNRSVVGYGQMLGIGISLGTLGLVYWLGRKLKNYSR